MSPFDMVSLFVVMLCLAAIPSSSVALVVVHAATAGVRSGLAVAAGIVAGDLIFVTLAIVGMTTLAEVMGSLFASLRFGAAAYLIWVGIGLIRTAASSAATTAFPLARTVPGGFVAGLLFTLGDVKAILFYASLFPVFLDLSTLEAGGIAAVMGVTVLAVGGVKAFYAIAAQRLTVAVGQSRTKKPVQMAAGTVMVGAGAFLLVKS